jgi:hypothetical protein
MEMEAQPQPQPQFPDWKFKQLLQEIEASRLSVYTISLLEICNKTPTIYGIPGSPLRRLIQYKVNRLKSTCKKSITGQYVKLLDQWKIKLGSETQRMFREQRQTEEKPSETINNNDEQSDDNEQSNNEQSNNDDLGSVFEDLLFKKSKHQTSNILLPRPWTPPRSLPIHTLIRPSRRLLFVLQAR